MNQFEFVQYETEPIEVQDPFQRFQEGNYEVKSFEEGVSVVIAAVIVLAAWLAVAWNLPHKMGRKGASRWVWFGLLAFPYTMFFTLLVLALSPPPTSKASNEEAEELKKQLESTKNELEASQQRVERYMDYVSKANSVIEKLQKERANYG